MFLIITMLIVGAILNFFAPGQPLDVHTAFIPIWAGLAAAGALKGGIDAHQNRVKQNKLDDFRRAAIRYSPWSGMGDPGPQSAGNTNTFGGMLGGGIQGGMIGALGGQAGLWDATATIGGGAAAADTAMKAQQAAALAKLEAMPAATAGANLAGSAGAMGTAAKAAPMVPAAGGMSTMSAAQQASMPGGMSVAPQTGGATGTWGQVAQAPQQQQLQGFLGAPINQIAPQVAAPAVPQTAMQQMYSPMRPRGLYSMLGQ